VSLMLCHYAECHYAECHYAECRGAVYTLVPRYLPDCKQSEQKLQFFVKDFVKNVF
jgi:hypothetical protein